MKIKKEISTLIPISLALFALMGFVHVSSLKTRNTDIQVHIEQVMGEEFVKVNEVRKELDEIVDTLKHEWRYSKLRLIEEHLEISEYVDSVNTYRAFDGEISIRIKQRIPIVRIMNKNGTGYYLDKNGKIMSLSPSYTARVLIVNGKINIPFDPNINVFEQKENTKNIELLTDIYRLALFVFKDDFWRAQIQQVNILKNNDWQLTPTIGNHTITLGDRKSFESKLGNLKQVYLKGLSKNEWNRYSDLNLKYKNQVVSTKR